MVLTCKDQALHSGFANDGHHVIGVEVGGVEEGGRLIPEAPLLVREGVRREVDEAVVLKLVPRELTRCREGQIHRRPTFPEESWA